jgi:hypothetical protein
LLSFRNVVLTGYWQYRYRVMKKPAAAASGINVVSIAKLYKGNVITN